ncbi:GGDEF domain-containing protein [Luteimonas yindakuii]|uniref:diguanylate cyclase n=1 Tax=Luteimonas yindakuii TaxID=2565782 RepID=A0A4Z1RHS0_9GAMM|nr:diguanylate cyclase [Luteimonas yindakuii]QCU72492.1 GGDEF domain-containing protein [Luteimonas yindakuii]TKS53679.1 GGDEF domain-containing protein [Luteimonas yindakuii]
MSAPSSRTRRLRIPAVVIALVLLLGAGIASVMGVRSFQAANRSLEHSYRVINLIEATDAAVRAAEANARGFRNTNLIEFRPGFFEAVGRATRLTEQLAQLTADHPQQQARARTLGEAIATHLVALQVLLDINAIEATDAEVRRRNASTNLRRVAEINALSQEMLAVEQMLLQKRRQRSEREASTLVLFIVLAMTIALVLLGLLLAGLARENKRSRQLEREARHAVSELQGALVLRDTLAEQRRAQSVYAGLLQSCQSRDELVLLTMRTMQDLVPGSSGRCYLSKSSQNFLESAGSFGDRVISSSDVIMHEQCWALRRGQPHYTRGRSGGLRCAHIDDDTPVDGISSLCVPLVAQGSSLGLLHISGRTSDAVEDNDAGIIMSIAEQMGMAIANLQLRETLRLQSIRDPLTGLFNRRYLEENLVREMLRCERRRLPLSLMMLDVDHFKRFNDQHGHAAGDAVLAHVGRVLQSLVRAEDLACRYGGEEFTIVLPETGAEAAIQRGLEICRAMSSLTIRHMDRMLGPITVSIGIATAPHDSADPGLLLEIADAALYRAKAEGRDRVLHTSAQA